MKIAFVFPGQGSQSVGMLDASRDIAVGARDVRAKRPARSGEDLWALVERRAAAKSSNLTINTQPVMLTAGVAV